MFIPLSRQSFEKMPNLHNSAKIHVSLLRPPGNLFPLCPPCPGPGLVLKIAEKFQNYRNQRLNHGSLRQGGVNCT